MKDKTVAIIGLGAIGNSTAKKMSKKGFNLILIDRDIIEEKNLSYQKLYSKKDIGESKAFVAAKKLGGKAFAEDLTFENIKILNKANIILDCTDNMETRFLINDYCVKKRKPWIYSAGIKHTGTTINFLPGKACFRCVFNNTKGEETCETAGISLNIINKISNLQVKNALKILSDDLVEEKMIRIISSNKLQKIIITKQQKCKACNKKYEYLEGTNHSKATKLCGSNMYQIKGEKQKSFEKINEKISIFPDGRVLIKANSQTEARSLYSKYIGN